MNPADMTAEQLHAELDALDAERLRVRDRAKALRAALNAKLAEEQADHWGLSAEEYAAAKVAKGDKPLHVALNDARRAKHKAAKSAQTAAVNAASVGAVVKGV
jgi:hypothetical protein